MAMGRRRRRGALGPILVLVAMTAGCRWIPARRAEDAPEASGLEVAEAALPALPPLRPIGDEEAFRPSAATPLLDAAATRDAGVKRAIAMELQTPDPPPITLHPAAPPPRKPELIEAHDLVKADPDAIPASHSPTIRITDATPDAPSPSDVPPPTQEVADLPQNIPLEPPPSSSNEPPSPRDQAEAASLWSTVLAALATPVPAEGAAGTGVESNISREPTAPRAAGTTLSISDLRLCRKVLGFGRTEPQSSGICKPGQVVLLYCEIDGLRDEEGPDGFRSRLGSTVAILPASGDEAVWREDLGIVEDQCRRRRRDFFVNYRITLPPHLAAGEYRIQVIQKDMLAGQETSRTLPLSIGP